MREIKFRAFSKKANGMVFLEYAVYIVDDEIQPKNDYILMQYIGLKDKNGIEIYEGDIVSSGRGKGMAVIYQAPKFVMKEKIKCGFSKCWSEFILSPEQNQFEEVIGNTYENPELLK